MAAGLITLELISAQVLRIAHREDPAVGDRSDGSGGKVRYSVDQQSGRSPCSVYSLPTRSRLPTLPRRLPATRNGWRFFHAMLRRGHLSGSSAFEAGFVSSAHSDAEISATIEAAGGVRRNRLMFKLTGDPVSTRDSWNPKTATVRLRTHRRHCRLFRVTELFQQLLDWVALHPHWSSALIFLYLHG